MTEDTPPVELSPSEAFDQAKAGFELFGVPIKKYSLSRKVAADAMGLKWGTILEEETIEQSWKHTCALRDVILWTWLCHIPTEDEQTKEQTAAKEWSVQRAQRKPKEAYAEAERWAEEQGIDGIDAPKFVDAYGVFLNVMLGEGRSRFAVTVTDAGPTPPDGNESGNE